MLEKEMFAQICDDFCADKQADENLKSCANSFCEYANAWLARRGVVGVGHTLDGISLRLANGEEVLLFRGSPGATEAIDAPAVSITGNLGSGARGAGGVANTAVKITG